MAESRLHHARPLKIVVTRAPAWAAYGPPLLEALGHTVICLYRSRTAPTRTTSPTHRTPTTCATSSASCRSRARTSASLRRDADRVGVVTSAATLSARTVSVLLARDILTRHPGAMVVADVLSTQVLF